MRDTQVASPFPLDRMLPFWSFVFNLKEVLARGKALAVKLGRS